MSIEELFNFGMNIIKYLSINIIFETHENFGYLTTDLRQIGAGLKIRSEIEINDENIIKWKFSTFHKLLSGLHLDYFNIEDDILIIEKSFKLSFCNEIRFIKDYIYLLSGIIKLTNNEKELSFEKIELNSLSLASPEIKESYLATYDYLKYKICSQGRNLNCLLQFPIKTPSWNYSLYLYDKDQYLSFYPFIHHFLFLTQKFNTNTNDHIHRAEKKQQCQPTSETLDRILNLNICIIRNLEKYPFALSPECDCSAVEKDIIQIFQSKVNSSLQIKYYSLAEKQSKEAAQKLIADNNLKLLHIEALKACDFEKDYPLSRGVIKFGQDDIYAIINDIDHIKLFLAVKNPRENLMNKFEQMLSISNELHKTSPYAYDNKFGFLTANPYYLGTGMIVKLTIRVKNIPYPELELLIKQKRLLKSVLSSQKGDYYNIEMFNTRTIGFTERELMYSFIKTANEIIEKDKCYKTTK